MEYPQVVMHFTFRIVPSVALTTGGRGHLLFSLLLLVGGDHPTYGGSPHLSSSEQGCILFDIRKKEEARRGGDGVRTSSREYMLERLFG